VSHPYNAGDRVWLRLQSGPIRATVSSCGWEHFGGKPCVYLRLDRDVAADQEGIYKFGCGPWVSPLSAIDRLAEITA